MGYSKDRTEVIRCRLSPEQKKELAARAAFLGVSMTDYVLSSALNRRLPGYGASRGGKEKSITDKRAEGNMGKYRNVVIQISENLYNRLIHMDPDKDCASFNESALVEIVQKGTLLPEEQVLSIRKRRRHGHRRWREK